MGTRSIHCCWWQWIVRTLQHAVFLYSRQWHVTERRRRRRRRQQQQQQQQQRQRHWMPCYFTAKWSRERVTMSRTLRILLHYNTFPPFEYHFNCKKSRWKTEPRNYISVPFITVGKLFQFPPSTTAATAILKTHEKIRRLLTHQDTVIISHTPSPASQV